MSGAAPRLHPLARRTWPGDEVSGHMIVDPCGGHLLVWRVGSAEVEYGLTVGQARALGGLLARFIAEAERIEDGPQPVRGYAQKLGAE